MEFRLLGPVEAWHAGTLLDLGSRKQRLVLSILLLEVNKLVLLDRLVELTWPETAPASASAVIRTHVYRLRSALADVDAARHGVDLVTTKPGYTLRADPDLIDAYRFRALVERGRHVGEDTERAALLGEALGLWRGPALADVAGDQLRATLCGSLEEARLRALEDRVDAELRLGRHHALVEQLSGLVREHPNRECLVRQLMLALHRTGRTPDALAVYHRTRARLAEQLGLDPSPELQRLHESILRADPELDLEPAPAPPPARPGHGAGRVAPAQLPADIPDFTGRAGELARLDETLSGAAPAVPVCTITGPAGVGKTALAVHWAHRNAGAFPDGQLYINLRGYTAGPPVTSTDALAQFLRGLGVPPEQVPVYQDEQEALYRSLLATRRMLVVLDNAERAEQVRPLLPGSPACAVLVTSRNDLLGLTALQGARNLDLDVLTAAEAGSLLERVLGPQRVSDQGDTLAELARLCGYLPLALRIAAANLAARPRRQYPAFVAELGRGNRLATLTLAGDDEAAVRGAFELTYRALNARQRRLFRLLGLVPGPDFDGCAAAALLDAEVGAGAQLLDQLRAVHLVRAAGARFQLHDLLRLYARELCTAEDEPERSDAALRRLFDFYLETADAASTRLVQGFTRLSRPRERPARPQVRFSCATEAKRWLNTERPNLIAAIRHAAGSGPRHYAWYLTDALRGYLWIRHDTAEWLSVGETGLLAARREGDQRAESAMRRTLGTAYDSLGDPRRGLVHHTEALRLSRLVGDRRMEASDLNNLGNLHWDLGNVDLAVDHLTRALDLVRALGNRPAQAIGLNNLGLVHLSLGELTQAVAEFTGSLALHREAGNSMREAVVTGNLGGAHHLLGDLHVAAREINRALALHREIGDRHREARVLASLAEVYRDLGRHQQAHTQAVAALALARQIQDVRAEAKARNAVADVHTSLGRYREAVDEHGHALQLARGAGYCLDQAVALVGLARAHRVAGDREPALARVRAALDLSERIGLQVLRVRALVVLAWLHLDGGSAADARGAAERAYAVARRLGARLEEARALRVLGDVCHHDHETLPARRHWAHAATLLRRAGAAEAAEVALRLRCDTRVAPVASR